MPIRVDDPRYGEVFAHHAFVPERLPERVDLRATTWNAVAEAQAAVARLDGASTELPHPFLVVRPMIRREAVSTSALEGTYAALDELLGAEATREVDRSETREVLNYVEAVEEGLELLRERPISFNLINRLHAILLRGVRGDSSELGRFRRRQNWIGPKDCKVTDAHFVPPPAARLMELFTDWEGWIHREDVPVIVRAALGHYQFEALHPYIDGNGRIGRLLIVLQLIADGLLRDHLISISPHLEGRKDAYVGELRHLSATGDLDRWVVFFADTLSRAATTGLESIRRLEAIRDAAVHRLRVDNVKGTAVRIAEDLVGYPVLTTPDAAERYEVSYPAARSAIEKLVDRGILRPGEERYRRTYYSPEVLALLR